VTLLISLSYANVSGSVDRQIASRSNWSKVHNRLEL